VTSKVHRLVYASVANPDLRVSELDSIITVAQRNNSRDGITGALVFAEGYFMQMLEGDRRDISNTLARIVHDDRHSHVCLIELAENVPRQFSQWAMRHISFQSDSLQEAIGVRDFDPFNWTASQCNAFFVRYSALVGDQ